MTNDQVKAIIEAVFSVLSQVSASSPIAHIAVNILHTLAQNLEDKMLASLNAALAAKGIVLAAK